MSTFHIIEDVEEQINSSVKKNSSVVEHQIEKKRIKTVGNFNSNGTPFATTSTASSAKISVTSTPEGKSVVSSLSMSLERKDSIQYMPRKIPPCIIPAGQSTVIHLDNYTHFMAQRVTTTKTAIKRAEIIGEVQKIVPGSTMSTTCSSSGGSNSGTVGVPDVGLKVILDGVTSSYRNNNKTLDMNKQKMQVSKSGPRKVRGRKNALALECSQEKDFNKMVDIQVIQDDPPSTLKSILKKPKPIRRRKVLKPRQSRKSKVKPKTVVEQDCTSNEEKQTSEILKISSPVTQPSSESKILRPCIYTLQNKKCISEITCQYFHSDFPCKYYYLNLHCPQDFKCQYMHNGPLEPKLMEALRSHILDLLSTKPSVVETHFIQQLHNIEDLTQRLQSFQKNENQQQSCEVIEVIDDDGDEDQVLVIDESSGEVNSNICTDTTTPINSISNPANGSQNTTAILQPTTEKFDIVYQNFKETNTIIDDIDQKLQNLKTTSNMTPNEKIHELQKIYELLKEQEKRLPIYENLNMITSEQISKMYNNMTQTNLSQIEQPHIVLVNPEIVNEIQNSGSQENIVTIMDDDDDIECSQATILNVPQESGIEIIPNETLPQRNGIGNLTNEKLTQKEVLNSNNNDMTNLIQENENNINMELEEDSTKNIEPILNKTNVEDTNNCEIQRENNEDNCTINVKVNCNVNNEIIENNTYEQLPMESEQIEEVVTQQNLKENLENNPLKEINETENQEINNELNNSTTLHNETLELALTLDEKEIIEGHIEQPQDYEEIPEEESPPYENIATTKKVKRSHIRLRSHIQQNNEEITNIAKGEKTTLEPIKPIKTRRLRLPKPIQKTTEKTSSDECQINADIINKLIQSEKNTETRKESTLLQDVEVPLTQNVILTKRFMKRAKAKLEQQSLLNETKSPANTKDICTNVEQNMMALHSKNNEIENIDVTLLTQTSDDSNSLTPSQDPLTVENYCEKSINKLDNEATTSLNDTIGKTYSKNKNKSVSCETAVKTDSKRRISFENPTSSTASSIKEQFNLGNPHVVLTKLKSPYLLAATQKIIQADSTTTNSNPIVTSSSNLLADNKCTQKRQCTSEYDLDSSLKENKHLKIDNSKSVRKVNFDTRKRTYSSQSNTSREGDFDTDSSDEKLTIADAMQTSSSTSSTSTDNERKQAFEPSLTHVATTHHHADAHQHVHKEQQENESDLRQQIENVSNKSDLQLQIQQQLPYQQKEVVQATTATISTTKNGNNNLPHKQYHQHEKAMMILQQESEREPQPQQYENNNFKEKNQIANTCNPYVNIETRLIQSSTSFKRIDECERPTSNSSDKYSNESLQLEKENIEYSTYSSLYNKLSSHSTKCQINFEDSTVHITPISSPTYGDDTIASPSPVRKSIDFRMGGEIDGRLTYPPIPYILHEIDLGKIDINKPLCIDKLKKTIQLDPRVFRTHVKKQLMTLSKSVAKTSSNALVHSTTFNTANLSTHIGSSTFAPSTSTMISPYDPRNRTPAVMTDIVTPSMSQQTALTPYNHINAAASTPSSLSSSFIHTDIPNAVPLALQYHTSSQPILQPQQQQTPNMFLYGCLQRSPWYQSLMSTMKIQINQSISQLVRALNNFHRERLLNPELVFDVFKIDCAGELLEIMRNLSIFVDANGIINEQRHVPSFGGRSCCNTMPVNATYSFIQQVLTPNTHCTSMTTASSNYNAAGGGGATVVGPLNVNEPFVSCYVKAPEPQQQKHISECCTTHYTHQDDNNNNNTSSNNSNCNSNCNRNYNNNNNGNDSGCNNNNGYNRRFGDGFKKPYDNNYNNNGNNNYRSNNQRSTYNNNPRFSKPGLNSPKSNSSPPNSPRGGFDGGSGNGYGGGGGRGFGGGRGGGSSGRFNNNRRFNNFSNNDKYNSSGGGGSSWSSASDSNENRYNNKFENNNSPTRASSPINSSYQMGSPRADKNTSSPAPANKSGTSAKKNSTDEECWDSDN